MFYTSFDPGVTSNDYGICLTQHTQDAGLDLNRGFNWVYTIGTIILHPKY